MAVQEEEKERGWFLFMQMDSELVRLDIGGLLPGPARHAKARPEFQVVNKYRFPDGNTTVPKDLAYTAVDEHLYMLGGKWFEGSNWNGKSTGKQKKQWGNLEVFECELEVGDDPEMDPVLICKTSEIPNMWGHKINPIVIILDRQIYVLARTFAGVVEERWPPLFEVFDPDTRLWKVLPNIPSIGGPLNATFIYKHFCWGNMIVVTSWSRDPATSAHYFYAFDTIQEKWEDASAIGVGGFPNFPVSDFACYNSFLIAKRSLKSEVVAYELNSNGIPMEVRVLDELQGIFYPRFEAVWHSLVTHLGDGLMCLVYHGLGPNVSQDDDTDGEDGALDTNGEDGSLGRQESAGPVLSVRVVLFQLSISENLVLSANVERVETYEFKHLNCPRMCPPFIKRGDLTNHARESAASLEISHASVFNREKRALAKGKTAAVLSLRGKHMHVMPPRLLSTPAEVAGTPTQKICANKKRDVAAHCVTKVAQGKDYKTVIGRRVQCSAQVCPPALPGCSVLESGRRTWGGPNPINTVGYTSSNGTQVYSLMQV